MGGGDEQSDHLYLNACDPGSRARERDRLPHPCSRPISSQALFRYITEVFKTGLRGRCNARRDSWIYAVQLQHNVVSNRLPEIGHGLLGSLATPKEIPHNGRSVGSSNLTHGRFLLVGLRRNFFRRGFSGRLFR